MLEILSRRFFLKLNLSDHRGKSSESNFGVAAGEACYRLSLFKALSDLEILHSSRTDPTLLNNSKMAAEGPGDLPVPDLRTMEELCQPSLNCRVALLP
nr:hypothetical protein [Tanacetum cinerariifolium]